MAGYLAGVRKAKNYAEFKKMHPDVDITRKGFLDLKQRGKTTSDADFFKTPPKTFSDEDLRRSLKRNDGGIAKKTRTF
jgi:hypothetical protein|tara:strand:- start:285 stop:518 length:234 start_codon:yes stop_codon:yes gene_type:complete